MAMLLRGVSRSACSLWSPGHLVVLKLILKSQGLVT